MCYVFAIRTRVLYSLYLQCDVCSSAKRLYSASSKIPHDSKFDQLLHFNIISIGSQKAADQGYSQDANNYYLWFTTSFSTHQVTIVFSTTKPSPTPTPTPVSELIAVVVVVVVIIAVTVAVLLLRQRKKTAKSHS